MSSFSLPAPDPRTERKNRLLSGTITLAIHLLIIGSMVFLGLHPPDPPWEDSGIAISLGEPDQGGPDMTPAAEQPEASQPVPEETTPEEEEIPTSDEEDAPVIKTNPDKKKPEETTKPTEVKPKKTEPEQKVNTKALFSGKRTNGDPNSQGQGDGDVPGNQGDPNGSENGDPHGTGSGLSGDGMGGYDLGGRRIKSRPKVEDASRATGKVVVTIYVDRNGKVVRAEPGARGTTATDKGLWDKAKNAAMQAEFAPRNDGPKEQVGTITFVFMYKSDK